MGYYCTVPQCTSLAGKTKNVKFHRFPRDVTMADKWNIILKRGKPYTKYSKVCSLHFTQADYNVTTMGQWKTLSKDALPSQNLPKLNPDGTVMVIRKSRTVKYKESKKDDGSIEKSEKWSPLSVMSHTHSAATPTTGIPDNLHADVQESLAYRLQSLSALANHIAPQQTHHNQTLNHSPHTQNPAPPVKPKKQDAIMQTDPLQTDDEENQTNHTNNSHSETSETSYTSDQLDSYSVSTQYQKNPKNYDNKNYEMPKDYTKSNEDYLPQTNEEYNKEAEKYALERKSHNGYEKPTLDAGYQKTVPVENGYQKQVPIENGYQKVADVYSGYDDKQQDYQNREENYVGYQNGYQDSADILRNQQHNIQILQEQHRITENQNFFNENHIKQEIDLGGEEDKFLYERAKEQLDANSLYSECQRRVMQQQRLMDHLQHQLKQEPDASNGGDSVMQPQGSPYYGTNGHTSVPAGYYDQVSRPGPELLIAKQNALAAHTQLWQNTVKRPFFYSETTHYNAPPLLHSRYEDLTKILQ